MIDEIDDGGPAWGRWFRQVDVEVGDSEVLMTGAAERPLLVLDRVGEGRVAQLLSDHPWLWARGVEQGGPQGLLLRRLVHWLMQEPELEEETLRAAPQGEQILIERRSIKDISSDARVVLPSGETANVPFEGADDGVGEARIQADERGLYRIEDGDLVTYAAVRPISSLELTDMRSTDERLSALADASGGTVFWLAEDGVPSVRKTGQDRAQGGRDWIGFQRKERYITLAPTRLPLLPAFLAMLLILVTLGMAWYREGR